MNRFWEELGIVLTPEQGEMLTCYVDAQQARIAREAWEDGYDEGFTAGYADGFNEGIMVGRDEAFNG